MIKTVRKHIDTISCKLKEIIILIFDKLNDKNIKLFHFNFSLLQLMGLVLISTLTSNTLSIYQMRSQIYSSMDRMVLNMRTHNTAYVYKLVGDNNCECAEVAMNPQLALLSSKFGNVGYGCCKDLGYDIFDREEEVQAGPFGKMKALVYKKSLQYLQSNINNKL